MKKIKLFSTFFALDNLSTEIEKWQKETNPVIVSAKMKRHGGTFAILVTYEDNSDKELLP